MLKKLFRAIKRIEWPNKKQKKYMVSKDKKIQRAFEEVIKGYADALKKLAEN